METPRPNTRTRKVVDYVAMNGDGSDESEDDFLGRASKVSTGSVPVKAKKPSKLSKLKLRERKKEKQENQFDSGFTQVKPSEKLAEPLIQPTPVSGSKAIDNIIDLSIAEPDLVAHSVCSQDTVLISSCECPSSQEFSDYSNPPSPAASTVKLLTVDELVKSTEKSIIEKISHGPSIDIKDRVARKRIIDETIMSKKIKKTRFEGDTKEENQLSKESQKSPTNPSSPVKSPCVELINKLAEETRLDVHQATSPKQPKILQKNSYESPSTILAVNEKIIEKSAHPEKKTIHSTPKSKTKVEDQDDRREFRESDDSDTELKNKAVIRKENSKVKLKQGTKLAPKLEVRAKLINPDPAIRVSQETNFKSPVSVSTEPKNLVTKTSSWKPPSKARGPAVMSTGNSPAIGLRLGLSRNRRAKPLHPDVKVKS